MTEKLTLKLQGFKVGRKQFYCVDTYLCDDFGKREALEWLFVSNRYTLFHIAYLKRNYQFESTKIEKVLDELILQGKIIKIRYANTWYYVSCFITSKDIKDTAIYNFAH